MDNREVNRGDQGEIPEEGIVGKGLIAIYDS